MESISGWIKTELFMDMHLENPDSIVEDIKRYIAFFNEKRPAYSLNYLTPKQYEGLQLKRLVYILIKSVYKTFTIA